MLVLKPHLAKFPKAYNFLAENLPKLPTRLPPVWRAFLRHSHLPDADARAALSANSGAPLAFAQDLGAVVFGRFDSNVPNRIEISRFVLEKFESDAANPEAQKFLQTKVLHELCHWGCHHVGVADPDIAGENFETELFGSEVDIWFALPISLLANKPAQDVGIFINADARAKRLLELLKKDEFAPGRSDDPAHKIFGGIDVAEGMTRGYRNNNPGNIRVKDPWMGLAAPDDQMEFQKLEKSFGVFREPEWGLRAIAMLLRKYKNKHGIDTPRKIIQRWAPASDGNDVESYSGQLASALGVSRDDVVNANDDNTAIQMMKAIATHENGEKPPYSEIQFRAALELL